jgi:hypothetical protein
MVDVEKDQELEELEGDEPNQTDGVAAKDKDQPAKTAESEAKQHQFDKDRQREQQELANAKRHIADLEAQIATAPKGSKETVSPEEENPLETLAKVKAKVAELEERDRLVQQHLSNQQFHSTFNSALEKFDKKHGPELRNEALVNARQAALDRGYSLVGNDHPEIRELCDLVEMGYLQAVSDHAKHPASKKKPLPKADTGRAGTALSANEGRFKGTPDQVMAHMRSQGRFRNLTTED